jgi:uncharacterized protein YcbX
LAFGKSIAQRNAIETAQNLGVYATTPGAATIKVGDAVEVVSP